jgi:glucose-1-phosphate cytidylyltransferase
MGIQTVILAGGTGTRMKEMTDFLPKPMVEIGGKPILYHIMKIYSHYGFNEFIVACGFKQEIIKQYFWNFDIINHDIAIETGIPKTDYHVYNNYEVPWQVVVANTGLNTLKGGRLKRVEQYVKGDVFMCTYGDGVGNVDIQGLLEFHRKHGKIATITGVHPHPRFGELQVDGKGRAQYQEKVYGNGVLANGGFMVMDRRVFEYLDSDGDLEVGPMEQLAREGELMCYRHDGYWGCCDTLKDIGDMQNLWDSGKAGWKVWK